MEEEQDRGPTLIGAARALFATELRAWEGREPLWKVFWCYGAGAGSVLVALYILALMQENVLAQQSLLLFFAAYTTWTLIAVWRCADNSSALWRALARSLALGWAGNAILMVGFLQLDILGRHIAQ